MAGSTQQFMFFLLVASAFAIGMWRGFSDPQFSSPPAEHLASESILRGSQSITALETTLARQQEMIDALLKSQANQQGILQKQQEEQAKVVETIQKTHQNNHQQLVDTLKEVKNSKRDGAASIQEPSISTQPIPKKIATPPAPVTPKPVSRKASSSSGEPVGHSHNSKGWEPAVVAHTLENTIKAVTKQRQVLKEKYGEDLAKELFMLDSQIAFNGRLRDKSISAKGSPVFLDTDSRSLLVKRFLAKLAAPKSDEASKTFVIAFGGHSSAAAHGNYFNQSYAHAFQRMLEPAMKAAGIKLVVRNHAMGGTGCIPSAYCSGNVYGEDLDAISWDFGMTDGRNIDHAELYFRQSVLQHHQSKAVEDYGLPPMLLLSHNTDNQREELLIHYAKAGFEVGGIRMNQAIDKVPKTSSTEHANHLPDALKYLECADSIPWEDCKAQRYDCIQQCGEEKGNICHGQVSWHPGWRYHQLKGDLISVIFLEALSDAARKYQTFTMEMGPNLDPDMYQVPSFPDERSLPPTLLCGKSGSSIDSVLCDTPLTCATSFEPRMGQGPLDLLSSQKKVKHVNGFAPQDRVYKANGWEIALAPGEGDNTAACTGHLDQKFNTLSSSEKKSQWLDLKITNVNHGIAIMCEGPFSARYAKNVGYFNMTEGQGGNVKMQLDGKKWHYVRKLSKSLCSVISDDLSKGDHTISLQATGSVLTGFSHLIWA